jgi:DeoR family transcriptional regulator, suf operon transcriptional repressor
MKSTREKVLQTLASNPRSTIMEIADSVGINAISVRHHLTSLQASSLVSAEEERHGVGRPRLVYYLTEKGMEKFPTRYFRLTNNLLGQMKESLPEEEVKGIFRKMADRISEEYKPVLKSLSIEEKLDLLKDVMAQEGYELTWEKNGEDYSISEVSCPFYQIGKEHPEICLFDRTLVANMLSIPESKVKHIRKAESHCAFVINNNDIK